MPKSKDAFRTISEVAEWLDTPAHVLRFWESKFTQVKPVKRAGGRRYYRPADMQLLGGIKKLLHDDGLTIKGAQKLLREHGVKHVAALSQPLDDDLLEDEGVVVQEAAYEPDAQPEPVIEEPATVLSFPSRAEPKADEPESAAVEEAPEQPEVPVVAEADANDVSETEGEDTSPDRAGDAPAFGSDALPAFLRRSPAQPTQTSDDAEAEEEHAAEVASETAESVEKVTINPTAHFEPVEPEAEPVPEATTEAEAEPVPQPMFSHAARSDDAKVDEASEETTSAEPAASETPKAPEIDVPTAAKIAPTLESYEADAGVLAALPGARRISPELAGELVSQLAELRALRDRMQSH